MMRRIKTLLLLNGCRGKTACASKFKLRSTQSIMDRVTKVDRGTTPTSDEGMQLAAGVVPHRSYQMEEIEDESIFVYEKQPWRRKLAYKK